MILGILIIGVYNRLSFYNNKVIDKFEAINNCLNERIDIACDIINFFNNDSFNEERLKLDLNNLSHEIKDENNVNNLLSLIDKSDKLLTKSLSMDNIYDSLKNSQEYKKIADKFKNNQYKIMYAIEIYNEEVEEYNNYKNKNIINVISKIFGFIDYNYYKK